MAVHLLSLAVHDRRIPAPVRVAAQVDGLAAHLVANDHRVAVGQDLELVEVGGAAVGLVGMDEPPVERVRAVADLGVHTERSALVRVPGDARVREQTGVHRSSVRIAHPPDGSAVRVEHDGVVGGVRAPVIWAHHIPPRLGLPVDLQSKVGEVLR